MTVSNALRKFKRDIKDFDNLPLNSLQGTVLRNKDLTKATHDRINKTTKLSATSTKVSPVTGHSSKASTVSQSSRINPGLSKMSRTSTAVSPSVSVMSNSRVSPDTTRVANQVGLSNSSAGDLSSRSNKVSRMTTKISTDITRASSVTNKMSITSHRKSHTTNITDIITTRMSPIVGSRINNSLSNEKKSSIQNNMNTVRHNQMSIVKSRINALNGATSKSTQKRDSVANECQWSTQRVHR